MSKLSFRPGDFTRSVADAGSLILKNRYYEKNPSLTDDEASLIARPGLRKLTTVGTGPIRGMASEAGSFGGDMFIASGQELYRMDNDLGQTYIYGNLQDPVRGVVNMAITASIGTTPEYNFVADGSTLYVYVANGYARNSLTGSPENNDQLRLGDVYYQWTNGDVDYDGRASGTYTFTGQVNSGQTITIDGTVFTYKNSPRAGYPTDIKIGATIAETVATTVDEINSAMTTVSAAVDTDNDQIIIIKAEESGTAGNSITIAESSSAITVSGATLTGGTAAGTPDGTSANPWKVALGGTPFLSFQNMYYAINASGDPGTNYSTDLDINPDVTADVYSTTYMSVLANVVGSEGNGIACTETGASIAWSSTGGTLADGGTPMFTSVLVPDDMGVLDVAVSNSYVLVVPVQEGEYIGRFYWIPPGEVSIDPLDFATAERSPDAIYGVCVFGDQFWLPGESTTEVYYFTGDSDSPVARLQGVVLDRGSWQDTAMTLHESMVMVDADGGVFQIQGSSPKRISSPAIEEQVRLAIAFQQSSLY